MSWRRAWTLCSRRCPTLSALARVSSRLAFVLGAVASCKRSQARLPDLLPGLLPPVWQQPRPCQLPPPAACRPPPPTPAPLATHAAGVKLIAFKPFTSAANALEQINAVSESQVGTLLGACEVA